MTRLRGKRTRAEDLVKPLTAKQKTPAVQANKNKQKERLKPLPPMNTDEDVAKEVRPKASKFISITVRGTKGEEYDIVVPKSYTNVPRVWEWTDTRYRVADLIAQGIPISQIPDYPDVDVSRHTIYAWMEHPEFRNHIDGMIMETGWASRRERMNNLKRLNDRLLDKVMRELDGLELSDKAVGPILTAIHQGAKMLAQEKGEFVEETKVTADVNASVEGKMLNISANVEDYLKQKPNDDRVKLEQEFDALGDDIISSIRGE